ncbi:MAG TPA: hypothetical protein VG757_13405 [Devosia sp.]|nr:hypothetical protein [Devosia sp.]
MFFIRSAFWLSLAFVLVAPHGVDLGAVVSAAKDQALAAGMQAGRDLAVSQIAGAAEGLPGLTIEAITNTPSIDLPMQDSPKSAVPFPRPRPHWMG